MANWQIHVSITFISLKSRVACKLQEKLHRVTAFMGYDEHIAKLTIVNTNKQTNKQTNRQ